MSIRSLAFREIYLCHGSSRASVFMTIPFAKYTISSFLPMKTKESDVKVEANADLHIAILRVNAL